MRLREKRCKKEVIMKKQKIKAMATKRYKVKRGVSLSSNKKENYDSKIKNDINWDQTNEKYLLQLWKVIKKNYG